MHLIEKGTVSGVVENELKIETKSLNFQYELYRLTKHLRDITNNQEFLEGYVAFTVAIQSFIETF